MNRFRKIRKLKLGNYFRELSIVIIGVAVTLYAGGIVNSVKEKKDLKSQLNAIYTEMEDNLQKVRSLSDYYERTEKLRGFLIENYYHPEKEELNDSIRKHSGIVGKIDPFVYKRGAYDMFISSGMMKHVKDRNLLLEITEVYAMLEVAKEDNQRYSDLKMNEIQKLFDADTDLFIGEIDLKISQHRSFYNFYISVSRGDYSKTIERQIEKILAER